MSDDHFGPFPVIGPRGGVFNAVYDAAGREVYRVRVRQKRLTKRQRSQWIAGILETLARLDIVK